MPKSNKPMESPREIEKRVMKVINGNFTLIIHKLDPLPIMRHLKESEILLDDYYEELWNKLEVGKTRANVNERLLGMLEKRERWWHPFIEALRYSGANDTADMIEEALPSSEGSELPESRIRRRDDQKAIVGRPESPAVVDEPKIMETPRDCEGKETSGGDLKDSTWRPTDDRILSAQQKKLDSGEAAQGQWGTLEKVEKYTLNICKDNIKENISKPENEPKVIYELTGKEKAVVKEEKEKNTEDDCKIHHPPVIFPQASQLNQFDTPPVPLPVHGMDTCHQDKISQNPTNCTNMSLNHHQQPDLLTSNIPSNIQQQKDLRIADSNPIGQPPIICQENPTNENKVAFNQDGNGPISNTKGNNVPDFYILLESGLQQSNLQQTGMKASPMLSSPGRLNGQAPPQASGRQGLAETSGGSYYLRTLTSGISQEPPCFTSYSIPSDNTLLHDILANIALQQKMQLAKGQKGMQHIAAATDDDVVAATDGKVAGNDVDGQDGRILVGGDVKEGGKDGTNVVEQDGESTMSNYEGNIKQVFKTAVKLIEYVSNSFPKWHPQ